MDDEVPAGVDCRQLVECAAHEDDGGDGADALEEQERTEVVHGGGDGELAVDSADDVVRGDAEVLEASVAVEVHGDVEVLGGDGAEVCGGGDDGGASKDPVPLFWFDSWSIKL